jgi:hypothetical protein
MYMNNNLKNSLILFIALPFISSCSFYKLNKFGEINEAYFDNKNMNDYRFIILCPTVDTSCVYKFYQLKHSCIKGVKIICNNETYPPESQKHDFVFNKSKCNYNFIITVSPEYFNTITNNDTNNISIDSIITIDKYDKNYSKTICTNVLLPIGIVSGLLAGVLACFVIIMDIANVNDHGKY